MGLKARSFASLANIKAPNVRTKQTNMVLNKDIMAFLTSIDEASETPRNIRSGSLIYEL